MRFFASILTILAIAITPAFGVHAETVDIEKFIKKDKFNELQISPGGEYYAATVPLEDRTGLAILNRADSKLVASFMLPKNGHVQGFRWVSPTRVIMSIAEKFGDLAQPQYTGELYAIDADGGKATILVGFRVAPNSLDTMIKAKKQEFVSATLIDDLPGDDRNVIITVRPFGVDTYSSAEKMDVFSGRRTKLAVAPVRNANYSTDHQGQVRFAHGVDADNASKLFYRASDKAEWMLINDETVSGRIEVPIGFSSDNSVAYLQVEQAEGPDVIVAYDVAKATRTDLLRDSVADPWLIIRDAGPGSAPVGVVYMSGKPRTAFFDENSETARRYRSLEQAFGGETVFITSKTSNGELALISTWSDRNPGDYYLFDTVKKGAAHVLSRREWLDPEQMATRKPVELKARDGLTLHGYLTLPLGGTGKNLPLVLLPHGGPIGIFDTWAFDDHAQILAQSGYAVLQVNFRGSGNYGRAFTQAGARQWGGTMQDDLTDATKWAISEGIADASRICIYGASYGGYAALMGLVKEPELYRCAVGYVGVYDLDVMVSDDRRSRGSVATFMTEWVGNAGELAGRSPNKLADRIKRPVLLVAGGEDTIAPIEHSKLMEAALRKANVSVETFYVANEGHGFYVPENRRAFYTRLLAFLEKNIGAASSGQVAEATGANP